LVPPQAACKSDPECGLGVNFNYCVNNKCCVGFDPTSHLPFKQGQCLHAGDCCTDKLPLACDFSGGTVGVCCVPDQLSCGEDADCCLGSYGTTGVCTGVCCLPKGYNCTAGSQCCSMTCSTTSGTCG
jgi:hypothetical protein